MTSLFNFFRYLFLKPVIKNCPLPNPSHLWFAEKSSAPSQFVEAKLTPLSDVESALNIQWTETILGNIFQNRKNNSFLKNDTKNLPIITHENVVKNLNELYENCIIRWLDDEIGWVFTLRPGKTLQSGFVLLYSGIMRTLPIRQQSSYGTREYFFTLLKNNKQEIIIDAKKDGNGGRLFAFLLEKEHLDNFELDPSIKNKIAVANLKFQFACLNGMKVPCIYAPNIITAPLHQELLLGLNYSLPYLYKMQQENKLFKLIDRETLSPLNPTLYPQKMIQVNLEGLSYSFPLSRFRIMIAKIFPNSNIRTMGFDENKKQYYEIVISNRDIFNAFISENEPQIIHIKPTIFPIK